MEKEEGRMLTKARLTRLYRTYNTCTHTLKASLISQLPSPAISALQEF